MKILYLVPYAPSHIRTRPHNLIRALAQRGHQITLATLWENQEERQVLEDFVQEGVELIATRLTKFRVALNLLTGLTTSPPLQADYSWQPLLAERVITRLGETPYDIFHVEHLRGARYGLTVRRRIAWLEIYKTGQSNSRLPIIWDSVDCISHLFEQAKRNSRNLFGNLVTRLDLPRTRRFESWLLHRFERVLVTSETDKKALERLSKQHTRKILQDNHSSIEDQPTKITTLPNGVDLKHFNPNDGGSLQANTLVVSGKMSYHANICMVLNLIQKIMPEVWEHRPEARLWVVGKDPSYDIQALGNHPQVTVTGTVPDIQPYLSRAAVSVAPLTYGAGIQNKVLEAMACGTPVVATSLAVSALGITPGREVLVADEPKPFARYIMKLLNDPEMGKQIGQAGRRYVERHHRWEQLADKLEAIYHEVIRNSNGSQRNN